MSATESEVTLVIRLIKRMRQNACFVYFSWLSHEKPLCLFLATWNAYSWGTQPPCEKSHYPMISGSEAPQHTYVVRPWREQNV